MLFQAILLSVACALQVRVKRCISYSVYIYFAVFLMALIAKCVFVGEVGEYMSSNNTCRNNPRSLHMQVYPSRGAVRWYRAVRMEGVCVGPLVCGTAAPDPDGREKTISR